MRSPSNFAGGTSFAVGIFLIKVSCWFHRCYELVDVNTSRTDESFFLKLT